MRATVALKAWPGTAEYRPGPAVRELLTTTEHLNERTVFICYAFALPGVEELGIGAWRLVLRETVLDAGIFYPDDLDEAAVAALQAWAIEHPVKTPLGLRSLRVLSKSDFLDDREVDGEFGPFIRNAYWGRAWVLGFDLGRTLGLLADRWAPARKGRWAGGWRLHFNAWERLVDGVKGQRRQLRSHRPSLQMVALATRGVRVEFGPSPEFAGKRTGVWENGRPYKGRFLDLLPAGFALDGVDDDDLDRHLAAWALEPVPGGPHFCAEPTPEGAELAVATVEHLHRMALAIDGQARAWGFNLPRLASPGTAAGQLLTRVGAVPPLARFDVDEKRRSVLEVLALRQGARMDEAKAFADQLLGQARWGMSQWRAASLGGLVEARPEWTSRLFEGLDVDLRSAYPANALNLGWWGVVTAEDALSENVTREFQAFLDAPGLAEAGKRPETWRRWGLTRCRIRADGHPLPVHLTEHDRTAVLPVTGDGDWAWPDVVRAVLEGGAVQVLEAIRLRPVGRQDGLQAVTTPAGKLGLHEDPLPALYRFRQVAKRRGDWRSAGWLRVLMNSVSYGNFGRFDPLPGGKEKPGPWCFPPLAATVAAGCRLLLGLLEADVKAKGGAIAYLDTDGAIVTGLDKASLEAALATYDQLCPWGGHFWSIEAEGQAYIFGPKRYVFLGQVHTEHSIGAVVPPPSMAHQDPASGHHDWLTGTLEVLARGRDEQGLMPMFPWEEADADFPLLRRTVVSSSRQLRRLPAAWSPRPFVRYVSAVEEAGAEQYPIALDAGGDLAAWDTLAWYDGQTGKPITVAVNPETAFGGHAVWLRSLSDEVFGWAEGSDQGREELPCEVHLDPRLIKVEGRSAGQFATWGDDVLYREPDQAAILRQVVKGLGAERFGTLSGLPIDTAKRLGRRLFFGRSTKAVLRQSFGPDPLASLLDLAESEGAGKCRCGCGAVVLGRRKYVSETHRKRRQRATEREMA